MSNKKEGAKSDNKCNNICDNKLSSFNMIDMLKSSNIFNQIMQYIIISIKPYIIIYAILNIIIIILLIIIIILLKK